jgi:ubiquinone/menaquinone biosynthesis C-methylase UbiE
VPDPTPHVERIRQQFTRQAQAYAEMAQTRDEPGLRLLVALSGAKPSDRVLDVACGPGLLTLAFAEACAEVRGIDATDALLERARAEAARRGRTHVQFARGDVNHLDLGDAGFDVVSCRAAFHHFPDPARVLGEMARVTKPGGTLLVADMLGSEDPATARAHDHIERLCDPTHTRAIPRSEFHAMFAARGLAVVHEPTSPLHYDVEEWMAHGGPGAATAAEIRRLFEESLAVDHTGLAVRREDGRLRFSHQGTAFVLRKPG